MPVKQVSSLSELKQIASTPRLTVVDCFAQWCGPCKAIAPFVEELSRKYAQVNFVKVDVDEAQEVAQSLSVRAMPTFVFFKSGKEVDRMEGASNDGLEKKVKEHGAGASAFEGQGRRLGDVNSSSAPNTNNSSNNTGGGSGVGATGNAALGLLSSFVTSFLPGTTTTTPATGGGAGTSSASASQKQEQQQINTITRAWPLEVPEGEPTGKVLLQLADGTRNPLKVAPALHKISDLYRGVSQMLERQIGTFVLSSREGMKTVELKPDDQRTLAESKVAGGVVLLR